MVCTISWDLLGAGSASAGCKCGVGKGLVGLDEGLAVHAPRGNSSPGDQSSWSRVKEVLWSLVAIPSRTWDSATVGQRLQPVVRVGSLLPWSGVVRAGSPPFLAGHSWCFWGTEVPPNPCLVMVGA